MKEYDLFAAIGGVDDRFLEELEQTPARRLPRHFGLIAALIALLLTACAAPAVIRNFAAVQGGTIVESERDLDLEAMFRERYGDKVEYVGPSKSYRSRTVSLEVDVSADAPETIEEYWLPAKLLECCNVESWSVSDTALSVELSMDTNKNRRVYSICYQQCVLPKEGEAQMEGILGLGSWEKQEMTYGDVSAVVFYGRDVVDGIDLETGKRIMGNATINADVRHIFWSDGLYLYGMRLVRMPPLGRIPEEDILGSMTAVEDLTEYLPAAE